MAERITLKVHRNVLGPNGDKLRPGQHVVLTDSPYVRGLVRGGSAELVDPPSWEYIDGPAKVEEPKVEEPKVEEKPKSKTKDLFKALETKAEEVSAQEEEVAVAPEPVVEDDGFLTLKEEPSE